MKAVNNPNLGLALFDFDGTITTVDTYTKFLLNTTPLYRIVVGALVLSPFILLHKLGRYPTAKLRPKLTFFAFWRRKVASTKQQANNFSAKFMDSVIFDRALTEIRWHQTQGHEIAVVSANVNIYLAAWCRRHQVNLISSELAVQKHWKNLRYTGKYLNGDCSNEKKALAVQSHYELANYSHIYAYGDTQEDMPMLALANKKYFQWQEIA
ncbi:HAD-IB family phosphatase [Thalassotalea montiporae]